MSSPEGLRRREFLGAALGVAALASSALAAEKKKKVLRLPEAGPGLPPLETIALTRLAYGPTPAELDELRSGPGSARQRFARWLEAQLHPSKLKDADCDAKLAAAKLSTLEKPLAALWRDHVVAANEMREQAKSVAASTGTAQGKPAMDDNQLRLQPARELEIAAWLRAVYSRRQLNEVLVEFWHDHFNVFAWDPQIAPVFVHYDRDVIRKHALGNFRELLEAVAKSPAMLIYLDNTVSQSANPNENYARELFELHTLGAESYLGTQPREEVDGYADGAPVGYVDGDVYEASRALTGWRVANGKAGTDDTGEFVYFEPWHDRFQKIVLGRALKEYQPPMKDGLDVLDLVAFHPATSRYVCRKLCRRLVADDPPETLVEATAKVFRDERKSPDQLRKVVRSIALSKEFRTTWGRKMKRPFAAAVGMLRATQAEFFPSERFLGAHNRTGQRLFAWRTPDGYPDRHERWGGTTPMLERWRAANMLVNGGIEGAKAELAKQTPGRLKTPRQAAKFWLGRVLGRPAPKPHVEALAEFIAQGRNPASPLPEGWLKDRLAPAVALALMSPEFQLS